MPVRIQHLLLRLQRYDATLTYKPGKELYIADTLPRAYLTGRDLSGIELDNEIDCHVNCLVKHLPLAKSKFEEFKEASASDIELQQLKKFIISGWPDTKQEVPNEVKPYWNFRDEINEIQEILFKGEKIIVPTSLRREMLACIHEIHLGIQKCMQRGWKSLFWPGMSSKIKDLISKCQTCLKYHYAQQKEPLIPYEVPELSWQRIAADLLQLGGEDYLLVIDYFSKYIELARLEDNALSPEVIMHLTDGKAWNSTRTSIRQWSTVY